MPDKSHLIIKAKFLFKSEKKADLPFWNKISNSTELQSDQVQIRAIFGIEKDPQVPIGQAKLFDISAAN